MNNLNKVLLYGAISVIILSAVVYFQRFHPEVVKFHNEQYEKKLTESEYEDRGIQKGRELLLSRIKMLRPKTKLEAQNYMKTLGYPREDMDWILKNL